MGKITQMAIHIPLPKNAIIRSKSGNTIAIKTGTATVATRMEARYMPRRTGGAGELVGCIDVGESPNKISSVVLMGRVLSGIFVIGMIAMIETTM
jgi:hypothetical protein